MIEVRVFDCPACGAPLPAAVDGTSVTCAFCSTSTVIESGGAAELKAREARAAAQKLFVTLGRPPSWWQRVAVVLANPWVWGLGFPFAFAALVRVMVVPMELFSASWERSHGERLLHVVSPVLSWVLNVGGVVAGALVLLVGSLLGQRVDARRELQAVLAANPPSTPGGPARCRHCSALLRVAAGALGERCTSCGADNLVMLPASWVRRAKAQAETLRVTAELAAKKHAEGRRRLRSAALWRVPMVAVLLLLVSWPAYNRRNSAGFLDLHLPEGKQVGVYKVISRVEHGDPQSALMGIAHCGLVTPRATTALALNRSQWCGPQSCVMVAMFALNRGERLRLEWLTPGAGVDAWLSLAPADYLGGNFVLADSFGDVVKSGPLSELEPAFEAPVAVSGFYKLTVRGPAEARVQPCIAPQTGAGR